MRKCYTHYHNISRFIDNINDSWRNSIYVTCSVCKHEKQECCDDLLISFDADGLPTIIMAKDANFVFGTVMDKSECLCEMSNAKFKCLFNEFYIKHTDEKNPLCPLLQIVKRENSPTNRGKVGK